MIVFFFFGGGRRSWASKNPHETFFVIRAVGLAKIER
jgi:hypothetical protein